MDQPRWDRDNRDQLGSDPRQTGRAGLPLTPASSKKVTAWSRKPPSPTSISVPTALGLPNAGGTNGGTYVTSLTPTLAGLVGDGEWDSEEIDFEVLHDPAYPAEGTGTVWTGAVTGLQQGELGKIPIRRANSPTATTTNGTRAGTTEPTTPAPGRR